MDNNNYILLGILNKEIVGFKVGTLDEMMAAKVEYEKCATPVGVELRVEQLIPYEDGEIPTVVPRSSELHKLYSYLLVEEEED